MTDLLCMQQVPPTEPVEEGDEGEWDTVGEPAGSRSPAPTVEELLSQLERQPPASQGSTEPAAAAAEEVVAAGARESATSATAAGGEATTTEAQEEAPTEARYCQHPWCPGRDDSPVKFVSAEPSRVVLG
jgi:hypothetical protein